MDIRMKCLSRYKKNI